MYYYFKWLTFFYIIIILSSCTNKYPGYEQFKNKHKSQFRVVTYNVNWGEKEFPVTAPQETINAIKYIDGDLVLLQEVTPFWYHNLKVQLSAKYPYKAYKGDNNAGGLAVLSKYPIINLKYKKANVGWHRAMLMTVKSPLGLLQAANFHLTPPLDSKENPNFSLKAYFFTSDVRKKEIEYYHQYLHNNRPTVLAGDFNEGGNGFVKKFLDEHGFTDAQAHSGYYSWTWKIGLFTLKRKLDHVFYNQLLKQSQSQILYEGDSDHYPIAVDLKLPET